MASSGPSSRPRPAANVAAEVCRWCSEYANFYDVSMEEAIARLALPINLNLKTGPSKPTRRMNAWDLFLHGLLNKDERENNIRSLNWTEDMEKNAIHHAAELWNSYTKDEQDDIVAGERQHWEEMRMGVKIDENGDATATQKLVNNLKRIVGTLESYDMQSIIWVAEPGNLPKMTVTASIQGNRYQEVLEYLQLGPGTFSDFTRGRPPRRSMKDFAKAQWEFYRRKHIARTISPSLAKVLVECGVPSNQVHHPPRSGSPIPHPGPGTDEDDNVHPRVLSSMIRRQIFSEREMPDTAGRIRPGMITRKRMTNKDRQEKEVKDRLKEMLNEHLMKKIKQLPSAPWENWLKKNHLKLKLPRGIEPIWLEGVPGQKRARAWIDALHQELFPEEGRESEIRIVRAAGNDPAYEALRRLRGDSVDGGGGEEDDNSDNQQEDEEDNDDQDDEDGQDDEEDEDDEDEDENDEDEDEDDEDEDDNDEDEDDDDEDEEEDDEDEEEDDEDEEEEDDEDEEEEDDDEADPTNETNEEGGGHGGGEELPLAMSRRRKRRRVESDDEV